MNNSNVLCNDKHDMNLTCDIPSEPFKLINYKKKINYTTDEINLFPSKKAKYIPTNFLSLDNHIVNDTYAEQNILFDNLTIMLPNDIQVHKKIPKYFNWCDCHIDKSKKNVHLDNSCYCKKKG